VDRAAAPCSIVMGRCRTHIIHLDDRSDSILSAGGHNLHAAACCSSKAIWQRFGGFNVKSERWLSEYELSDFPCSVPQTRSLLINLLAGLRCHRRQLELSDSRSLMPRGNCHGSGHR